MSDHSANLARIAVQGILQSFGMSGIKSRQALDRIEADGYAIVKVPTTPPVRYYTCVQCEKHVPESDMEPDCGWCKTCWSKGR